MIALLTSLIIMAVLLTGAIGGIALQHRLPESHRDRRTVESVLLIASMFVTFSALVLSLLTLSVENSFQAASGAMRGYSIELIQLNRMLREYGPATAGAERLLRAYTAAAIASTWPSEPLPAGSYFPRRVVTLPGTFESRQLGGMLHRMELDIRHLQPNDAFHRRLADDCLRQYGDLLQTRWKLIEQARSSVSMPFLAVLVLWLAILFISFGLTAPRNRLVYVMISLCAFAIAAAIFVILEMATPLTGLITISSQPMRDALAHMAP